MVYFVAFFVGCFNPILGFAILALHGIMELLNRGNRIQEANYYQQAAMLEALAGSIEAGAEPRDVVEVEAYDVSN